MLGMVGNVVSLVATRQYRDSTEIGQVSACSAVADVRVEIGLVAQPMPSGFNLDLTVRPNVTWLWCLHTCLSGARSP